MKYLVLIDVAEQVVSATEREACDVESAPLAPEHPMSGPYRAAHPLRPTAMATSVRVCDGRRFVTDGPFAATRAQLGGCVLIDAQELDEAIGIATRIPMARLCLRWRKKVTNPVDVQ
jgi:hypothetical protein